MLEVQNVAVEFGTGGQWWRFTLAKGIGRFETFVDRFEIGALGMK
jgi:hypothetical protein